MKKVFNIKNIIILGLVAVILFMKFCTNKTTKVGDNIKRNNKKYEVVDKTTDTVYRDTGYIVYKKGKTIYKDVPVYVKVPINVDTQAILKEYYAIKIYKDTFTLKDSLGTIAIQDTISENKIVSRTYDVKVREKIIRDIFYVREKPRNEWYVGGNAGVDAKDLFGFVGSSLLLKNKKERIYNLGLGLSQSINRNITPMVFGGVYYKLHPN